MDTRHAFKGLTKQLLLGGYHTGRLDCLEALRSAGRSMAKANQLD